MAEIINFPKNENTCVTKVSVQVSKYQNEGAAPLYVVETLFPDGTWTSGFYSTVLTRALQAAKDEAKERDADLLPESLWPYAKLKNT